MPRKKAEPEVLQEETAQPEITQTEDQPALESQAAEPAITEPAQPYGEDEALTEEENSEPSEPEKKSFYDLDFRALDQDHSPEQRQEWNTIYASFRSRSVMRGTIIGVDPHSMTVRSAQTGQVETKRMYCAVIVPFRARILIPETEMWAESEERPRSFYGTCRALRSILSLPMWIVKQALPSALAVWRCIRGAISSPHSRSTSRAAVCRVMCWPLVRAGVWSSVTATT